MNLRVRTYQKDDYLIWNKFVAQAKNATFLFHRDFMEYHQHRFDDFSLLIFNQEKLVAVLPANRVDNQLYSHQGLTYGGLLVLPNIKLIDFLFIFEAVVNFIKNNNFGGITFKVIPPIYNSFPSDELEYALFLHKAKLIRRDTLSVIQYQEPTPNYSSTRKTGIKKAEKLQLNIIETNDFSEFWNKLLYPTLRSKYQTNPVHSLEEIQYLHQLFPENIRQYNVYHNDQIIAGTTVFESKYVAHIQYIASHNQLRDLTRGLDYLFDILINKYKSNKRYFDFGISNEQNGTILNSGLSHWKESFGASTIVQNFYYLEL